MRRLLTVLVGGLGLSAVWRRLQRRPPATLEIDPAAGLRAKLAASRTASESALPEGPSPGEGPAPGAVTRDPAPLDPAARRQAIHDRARGAMDELR